MSKEAYQEAMNRIEEKLLMLTEIYCDPYSTADVDAVKAYVAELLEELELWRVFKEKNRARWEDGIDKIRKGVWK